MEAAAPPRAPTRVKVVDCGRTGYSAMLADMRRFTAGRDEATPDQIWLTEHDPVYTLGLAASMEHVLDAGGTPVVQADRGGQVTWHGPGQAVIYLLVDLARRGIRVREMVHDIESAVISTLAAWQVRGSRRSGMPGVYVGEAKIAALGLKVSRGRCYHGVSLNVDCDLTPFRGIHPCGYPGLESTSLAALGVSASMPEVRARLADELVHTLESHQ